MSEKQLNNKDLDYWAIRQILGINGKNNNIVLPTDKENLSPYNYKKYKYLLFSDFNISDKCCNVMKKRTAHLYQKQTKRYPIIGIMASESALRMNAWTKNGCNAYNASNKNSTPLSFWTEQDIFQYILQEDLEIASVYGDIIEENGKLKTTRCNRTGCVFCGFGCHLEKEPNRFQKLKETHPKLYDYCINGGGYNENGVWEPMNGGLGLGHVLDEIGVNYK